jgi:hypothetical protein
MQGGRGGGDNFDWNCAASCFIFHRYNTDDNLTHSADNDFMSDDDFDEDETPSAALHGVGLCDSPKVRPSSLSLSADGKDTTSALAQGGPSNDESWGQMCDELLPLTLAPHSCIDVVRSGTAAGMRC